MTTYLAALQGGLACALENDSRVYLIGEDLLDPYGGAFKVSQGLSTRFPGRVLTTPISEAAIVGVGAGMALRGLRPVVEIMFGDFITLCADQLVNHASKFRAMYGDRVRVPLVVRTPMGGGRGYGPTHSQSLEKLFLGVPGLKVAAPSHAHDPGELLRRAVMETEDPVLFVEHKLLYPAALLEPGGALRVRHEDEIEGFPTAVISNYDSDEGAPDVTLIAYGGTSRLIAPVMESLRREEIRILAALPSSLKPVPLATLARFAAASGRVVVVEEGTAGFNWGSEIAAALYEALWGKLKAPIRRLASAEGVIPSAKELEEAMLVNSKKIEEAVLEALE